MDEELDMAVVSCDRKIQALWCNEEKSNAWVWLTDCGWRKLDDRNDDACTNLLIVAAEAKQKNALVKVREEFRNDKWYITELYDLYPGQQPAGQEVSFRVTECIYGWQAAFRQKGAHIMARIQLDPDSDVSASLLEAVQERWKNGIEKKWSYKFACCNRPTCSRKCAVTFNVEWVTSDPHLVVRVKKGGGRSNLRLWHTDDSGDVAAHEFGHLLGHPDEYRDSNCPDRNPVNTGTIMDDLTEVVERYYTGFCDRLSQDTAPA